MATEEVTEVDVVVIGAGLSGLSAANVLSDGRQRVLVLEARDRVGGRTYTIHNDQVGDLDLGAAYVGVMQNRLLRVARRFGVKTYPCHEVEDLAVHTKGKTKRFRDNVYPPTGGLLSWLDLNNAVRLLDNMRKEVPINAPWKAPRASEWDKMTLQQFFDKHVWTRRAMEILKSNINVNVTSEAYEVSMLWFLWYLASAGGPLRINSTTNGAQERKFHGGSQQISEALAKVLGKDRVLLNRAVRHIEYDDKGVTIVDVTGTSYRASYCIVALAPTLQTRISWSPPLPARRLQMLQRLPMGSVIKTFMYYKTPFWRKKGFCGSAWITDEEGLVADTMDHVHPDGSHPAIMGFILADRARRTAILSKEERKQRISRLYAKVFQSEEGLHPVHYEEKNWSEDEWSGGCYTVMMPPGFLTVFGEELRRPLGRVYFAGTETAAQWAGYMDGAIEAGERAAREILHAKGLIRADEIWQNEPEDEEVKPRPLNLSRVQRMAPTVPGFIRGFLVSVLVTAGIAWRYWRHRLQ